MNKLGIIGTITSILLFSIYYTYDYYTWLGCAYPVKNLAYWMRSLMYYGEALGLFILILELYFKEKNNKIKYLIYHNGFCFWFGVIVLYLLKDLEIIPNRSMIIYVLISTAILSILLYFLRKLPLKLKKWKYGK